MDQTKRDGALEGFRSGRISIPLAVDVAARRLHVAGVRFVANYDFPGCLEQVSAVVVFCSCSECSEW